MREIIAVIVILTILLAASIAYASHNSDTAEFAFLVAQAVSAPQTTLTANPISGTAPLTVVFTALCQDDGLIASCVLSFGDGTTKILSNIQIPQVVQHTYTNEGTFLATLTAVDNQGNQDQTPATITISASKVNVAPQTELAAIPIEGRSPFEVTFIAKCSDFDGTISSCEIEFGDGETTTLQNIESPQTVVHQYVNTENVKIFRAAILKAVDDKGASDQTPAVKIIGVLPGFDKSPQTFLDAFPRRGKTPLEVTFVALCFDADGDISTCRIDFGDGEEEELLNIEKPQEVTHVYTNTKVDEIKFKAELKATDDDGLTDPTPAVVQIVVETDIANAPNTILSATPLSGASPLEVTFTARCTDLQKRLAGCTLDFGDGTFQKLLLVETAQTVKHVYFAEGKVTYLARLFAKDQEGLIDLSPASVTIIANPLAPEGGAVTEKTVEFNVDVKNVAEEKSITARKRVFNGLLFGSNELRINIPPSHVKKIILEVRDTNNLNDLYMQLNADEIYRDQPDPGIYEIEVGEDFEGTLTVRASSSGFFNFWTVNFYNIKVTVVTEQAIEQENEFSFVLSTLLGLQGAVVERWPPGVSIILNDVQLDSPQISKNIIEEFNTVRFVAAPDVAVRDKAVIKILYAQPPENVQFQAAPQPMYQPQYPLY